MPIPIGSLTINVPDYLIPPTGKTINQGYEFDLEYQIRTGNTLPTYPYTGNTTISYIGIGTSRLDEKRKHPNLNPIWNIYLGLNSWQQPSSERG